MKHAPGTVTETTHVQRPCAFMALGLHITKRSSQADLRDCSERTTTGFSATCSGTPIDGEKAVYHCIRHTDFWLVSAPSREI